MTVPQKPWLLEIDKRERKHLECTSTKPSESRDAAQVTAGEQNNPKKNGSTVQDCQGNTPFVRTGLSCTPYVNLEHFLYLSHNLGALF